MSPGTSTEVVLPLMLNAIATTGLQGGEPASCQRMLSNLLLDPHAHKPRAEAPPGRALPGGDSAPFLPSLGLSPLAAGGLRLGQTPSPLPGQMEQRKGHGRRQRRQPPLPHPA